MVLWSTTGPDQKGQEEAMSADLFVQHMLDGANFYRSVGATGDASALTPQQSAALLSLGFQFNTWREKVLAVADRNDDSTGDASNLRNLVSSAVRSFNRFIEGDVQQGTAMRNTMNQTMDYIRQINADNSPSLQEAYTATTGSLSTLIVGVAATAGQGAGALIASAAKELDVKPADIGSGIGKIAIAAGLIGGAVILTQAKSIVSLFKRRK